MEQTEEMLDELRREVETTRRVLDRIPEGKLTWRPHPKSMTLGQLAMHVASIPGSISHLAALDEFDAAEANFESPQPSAYAEISTALATGLDAAAAYLQGLTADDANASWRLTVRGTEVFAMPRAIVLRNLMMNHWYHHRGQLSVYLRLLDVPVPVIYGRSADENPFG